jgi:hypothetical protein
VARGRFVRHDLGIATMLQRFRQVFGVVFLLMLVAACSGGGCTGCTGCGGTTALPGGFPKERTIENAGAVRLSRQGLDFLEQNLPTIAAQVAGAQGGKLVIPIPETPAGANVLCPGGPDAKASPPRCVAEVDLGAASFRIDAVKPNALDIRGILPLQVDNTPVKATFSGITLTVNVAYGTGGACKSGIATADPYALPVRITLPLVEETTAPRSGYTKIDVDNAVVDLSGLGANEVQLCANCGFASLLCDGVLSLAKTLIVDQLKAQIDGQVKGLLRSQLCVKPTPSANPPCPTGSKPTGAGADATCTYDSTPGKCVSTLLGTDAHVELGSLLASISPGSQGALDFGFAAGGAMNPAPAAVADGTGRTPNGVSLAFIGGVIPKPPSTCVPDSAVEIPLPTGIPVPDVLIPTQPDAPGSPHVRVALAGRFLQYALGSVYRSGLLCIGTSTEQFDLLKTGLISLVIPSLKQLTFEQGDAAAAIATRPQVPPTVVLGGGTDVAKDPLLKLTLPRFALDFYVWSHDRYVRAFTFEADLTVPINLQTGKDPVKNPAGGIVPVLGDIGVANGVVTHSEMLMEEPAQVAAALTQLLGGLSKQLLGAGIAPLDVASALASFGLGLEIGEIGKVTKGSDDFLTVSASFAKSTNALVEADTMARLRGKTVDPAHMGLATLARAALPSLELDVSSSLDDGRRDIEYTWWIDQGTRAPWARIAGGKLVVQDDQLTLQGRHVLRVSSRIAGQAATEDATPAEVPFVIDALAPFVTTRRDGSSVTVSAWDVVSPKDALVARFRREGAAEVSPWVPLADLGAIDAAGAPSVTVEVKDEEGNIRTVTQELVRGRADGSIGSGAGCGCQTPGTRASTSGGLLAAVISALGLGAVVLRRRRGTRGAVIALGSLGVVAASSQGCSCGSEDAAPQGCGADCLQECRPALSPGMPGSYTSVAKAKDGTIWVAGYNDALLEDGDAQLYGDLVVGTWDAGKQKVDWTTIDGVPKREIGCPDHDRSGWRGGETDSGEDVGLWTSLQVTDEGKPVVAYYDATNRRLKVAIKDDGWKSFVLQEAAGADVGRYAKMVLVAGKPVVAYLRVEPGNGGRTRSKVVVARAKSAAPKSAADFAFADVNVDEDGPCRDGGCAGGQACVKATGVCTETVTGCQPACTAGSQACVTVGGKATCEALMGTITTYPRAVGAYLGLAKGPEGLGIVAYDAVRGNLLGFAEKGGTWTKSLLDGETGSRPEKTAKDTGDVGIAASLFIDNASTWHVTYVSGLDETLRYLTVDGGTASASEVIDDGSSVDGARFPEGRHLVGDDSAVRLSGDAVVVYYQDATTGVLRRATGARDGAKRRWELRALAQANRFAGFFPQFVPGEDRVTNWWRQTERGARTVTGDVSILTP